MAERTAGVARKAPAKKAPAKRNPSKVTVGDDVPKRKVTMEVEIPEAELKAYEAHQMRMAGAAWKTIAEHLGYSDHSGAIWAVNELMRKIRSSFSREMIEMHKQMELERFDELHRYWWPMATVGLSEKAADIVLKVSDRRVRLMDLDGATAAAGSRTVVIAGQTGEYVESIKALVGPLDKEITEAEVLD